MHATQNSCARNRIRIAALFCAALSAPPSLAGVEFSNIADTTTTAPQQGQFTNFFGLPVVDGSTVAFMAQPSGGGRGIYVGTAGTVGVARIAGSGDAAPGQGNFTNVGNFSVSGSNVVFAGSFTGGQGLYTATLGSPGATKVVDSSDNAPGHGPFKQIHSVSVSGNTLAFSGSFDAFGYGAYTGTVGTPGAAKIADTDDTAPGRGRFTSVGGGYVDGTTLIFRGNYSGGEAIYAGNVGSTGVTKIVATSEAAPGHGAFSSIDFGNVSGNRVAFWGAYGANGATPGIYVATVGIAGATKVVDTSDAAPGHGKFTSFITAPSISGDDIAFFGNYAGGGGIYVMDGGAGGTLWSVLNTGDHLFGSTVATLALGRDGYDERSHTLAFSYTLADGRSGIATAIIPEPASPSLLAVGHLALLRRRCRRSV